MTTIKAIKIITELYILNEERNLRIRHNKIHKVVGRSTNLHISNIVSDGEVSLSRLNDKCTFGGAISFPPGEELNNVKKEIENGKLNGSYNEWYEDGQKMIEVTYQNGKEDGLVTSWYSNGQKKDMQIYKNDKLVKSLGKWYEDGSEKE